MSIKTFPPVIFISVENAGTQDEYMSASLTPTEAIGNENQKIVGIYHFVIAHDLTARPPLGMKRRSKKTT